MKKFLIGADGGGSKTAFMLKHNMFDFKRV